MHPYGVKEDKDGDKPNGVVRVACISISCQRLLKRRIMSNLCEICGNSAVCKNLCNKHYLRLRIHGNTSTLMYSTQLIEDKKTHGIIKLYNRKKKLVFDGTCDVEDINRIKSKIWFYNLRTKQVREKGKGILLPHFILRIPYKTLTKRIVVFKDSNTDYRKQNLRLIPKKCVHKKEIKKGGVPYTGVFMTKRKKFSAVFINKGKRYYLGQFSDMHLAARTYNAKAKELLGDAAILNKIKNE